MAPTISLHVLISAAFFLAMTHKALANDECPDDADDASIDQDTGCLTRDVPVIMLSFPPYVILTENGSGPVAAHGIAFDYIADTFERCCENDLPIQLINKLETDIESDSFDHDLKQADFIFPVTEELETKLTFSGIDYTFHDIVKSHGYVLIGRIDHYNKKARRLVLDALYDSWPIFAMTFLLAGIAGIFIWGLEFHIKNEEFPLSFTRGSYEGFWWAFISMTTVGYGDKTPRSFCGRMFGVLWILLGLIVITMFTATVTSALTNSSSPEFTNSLEGQDVAVLLQDSKAQAEASYFGAVPHQYEKVEDLEHALLREDVDGIFMERLQAYYYFKGKADDDNLRVFDAHHTDISYKMALKMKTTCVFLKTNFCFRRRLENPIIDLLVKSYTTPLKVFKPSVDAEGLLSGSSANTAILLLAMLGVFLGLVILGVLVEIFVLKSGKQLCKPASGESSVSDIRSLHVNVTLRHLENLERDLEKLSSRVQTMKENLASTNGQQLKSGQTDSNLKLTEICV